MFVCSKKVVYFDKKKNFLPKFAPAFLIKFVFVTILGSKTVFMDDNTVHSNQK